MDTKQVQEIQQVLDTYRTIACSPDRYQVKAPEALRQRAAVVYEAKREPLSAALKEVGAADADIAVILEDYRGALLGNYEFKATVEQIHKALEVRPRVAYKLGKFEVHAPLYTRYTQQEASWNLFLGMMRTEATIESRRHYILSDSLAFQVCHIARWAAEPGRLRPSDFEGVTPGELSRALMMAGDALAGLDYFAYIFTAKYGLNATHEELEMVNTPESATLHFEDGALDWAESSAEGIAKEMAEREMYFRLLPDPLKKAEEKAEETAPDLETPKPLKKKKVTARPNLAQFSTIAESRNAVNTAAEIIMMLEPGGQDDGQELRVLEYNAARAARTVAAVEYLTRWGTWNGARLAKDSLRGVTDLTVQQTLKALGLLMNRDICALEGGYVAAKDFVFDGLSLSRFVEIATGYADAGQPVKDAYLNTLKVLSNVWIVVRMGIRKSDKKPKLRYVRAFSLRSYDNEGGLDLRIATEFQGTDYIVVPGWILDKLLAFGKGSAEKSRFTMQVLAKGHKFVEELLDAIFGYSYKLDKLAKKEAALRKAAEAALAALPDLEREYKRMKDADKLEALRDKCARWEAYKAAHLEAEETERVHKIRAAREAYEALYEQQEAIKKEKRAQGKNKARDRDNLALWFEQCQAEGLLTFTPSKNKKGQLAYDWAVGRAKTPPEEQKQEHTRAAALTS